MFIWVACALLQSSIEYSMEFQDNEHASVESESWGNRSSERVQGQKLREYNSKDYSADFDSSVASHSNPKIRRASKIEGEYSLDFEASVARA